jgi:hypothetical protein
MDVRVIARELGFLLLFLTVAVCLTPSVLQAMGLTSEGSYTNRLEDLFLIQRRHTLTGRMPCHKHPADFE